MSGPAAIMREVHRLRRLARELKDQLDRGPRLLKARQDKAAVQETRLRELQDGIKKLKVSAHEKEVSIKTTQNQIAKYTKQVADAANKKEYDALQNEIAAAKAQAQNLEDEALAALTRIDEETARIPEFEAAVKTARADVVAFEKGMAERNAEFAAKLKETEAKIAEVEATIPTNIREQFNRVVSRMGHDGFAAVENRNCSACYTTLTIQDNNELIQEFFLPCKACGRILYLAG